MHRGVLIISLLFVSLVGDAKISLPDSLLTITKAYTYNITSPDTAQAILDVVRERKLEPEWRVDFAEGDLNLNMRRYHQALTYYERVGKEPSLRDSTRLQLLLLKNQMDCYDALIDADKLTQTIVRLRNLSRSCGDKAFETMTYFTSGKWHHYNGQKEKGFEYCQKAVEMLKATDYANKHIELRTFYAELLNKTVGSGDDAVTVKLYPHTNGAMGVINNVFGGGNAAKVDGNTTVNVGTTEFEYLLVTDELTAGSTDVSGYYTRSNTGTAVNPVFTYTQATGSAAADTNYYRRIAVVGADIRGNVYGGGNKAEVTGNTNVNIGKAATE